MNWINPYEPKKVKEKLKDLLGTGISQAEAARRIGCSDAAVHYALKGMNFKNSEGREVRL